jgi:hypothetical protein
MLLTIRPTQAVFRIFGISLFEKVFGIILGTLCGNWASNLEKF